MSLECSECERDLRGSHDPGCSRYTPQSSHLCDDDSDDMSVAVGTGGSNSVDPEKYHSRCVQRPVPLITLVILRIVADRDRLRAENDELKKRLSAATSDIIYLSDALGE